MTTMIMMMMTMTWQIHKYCALIHSFCKLYCVVILKLMFFFAFDIYLSYFSQVVVGYHYATKKDSYYLNVTRPKN